MRTKLILSMGLLVAGILFISCERDIVDAQPKAETKTAVDFTNEAIINYFKERAEKRAASAINQSNGAEFIEPFFMSESFGVANVSFPNFVFVTFGADLDHNDFYRQNTDGTVSVHITSNQAFAEYAAGSFFEPDPETLYQGDQAHLNVNYTGNVVVDTFIVPVPPFDTLVFTFLNAEPNENAMVWQGQGRVDNMIEPGDSKRLKMKLINNPGGGPGASYTFD